MCRPNHYTCGPRINQCYEKKQRCDGIPNCTNMMDELYCTSRQCGHHNGTFLCGNGKCIYEMWKCDRYDHCGDNSDEEDCSHVTNEIKIAAVCGALICGLLLVVAFGCTCKLYNLRVHGHQHGRHETPLSRLYSEFMRRRAPPPYHEAMLTSRPYDEVRRDYLEHLQQVNARPPSRRGRRNRNRNSDVPAATDGNSQENSNGNQNGLQEETQNSVNAGLERQNSTSLLLPESSASSDFDTDTENQTESVQVSISEENVVTAAYSRSGSQSNKSDSEEETNISPPNQTHPELDSVDICSVDATIASCDSMEDSDKPIEAVVVETITPSRHGSEESLDSIESEDHSFGEFTIAEC